MKKKQMPENAGEMPAKRPRGNPAWIARGDRMRVVLVRLPVDAVGRIDAMAAAAGRTRTDLVRGWIMRGISDDT